MSTDQSTTNLNQQVQNLHDEMMDYATRVLTGFNADCAVSRPDYLDRVMAILQHINLERIRLLQEAITEMAAMEKEL